MEEILYSYKTSIDSKEYKKLLFRLAFFKNRFTLPLIFLICLVGAFVTSYFGGFLSVGSVIGSTIVLLIFAFAILIAQINQKRTFSMLEGTTNPVGNDVDFIFYDDGMEIVRRNSKFRNVISYDEFKVLRETNDLFLFYSQDGTYDILNKKNISDLSYFEPFIKSKFKDKYKPL